MCDLLKRSALAYNELSAYEYNIVCGRKEVKTCVIVKFPKDAYHHLAGFQYTRLSILKERKTALDKILSDRVSYSRLIESGFKRTDRLESIILLQKNLETNNFVFRYSPNDHPYSKIQADYLMSFDDIVFFIKDNLPISIFKSVTVDYKQGCTKLVVLQIRRMCLSTKQETVTYQREGYSE